ncbi:T9SS type A sorting domain-containing protein [Hymenobacter jejuensis]|nr:T9SS type A sorting domain-containing protein [Hymenobacter jejuensis]
MQHLQVSLTPLRSFASGKWILVLMLWLGFLGNSPQAWAQCSNCTQLITGDNNGTQGARRNFAIGKGDVFCISSGVTYTGQLTVNSTGTGATPRICISSGGFNGSLVLNGPVIIDNNTSFVLPASSSVTFPTGSSFTNNVGATASFNNVSFGSQTTLTNSSTITSSGTFSSSGTITNNYIIKSAGSFTNSGTLANLYLIIANSGFTNSGTITGVVASDNANTGRFVVKGASSNSGNFGVGASGGRLDFCDAEPGAGGGFNSQTGPAVGSGVSFCKGTLPVELVGFTAKAKGNEVALNWSTASEKNNAKFVVERSANAADFEAVLEVAGRGNSQNTSVYAATDQHPLAGTSYYRLRQVDRDGAATYSSVVSVNAAGKATALRLYPNPATDHLTLDLRNVPAERCAVQVLSLTGRVLQTAQVAGGSTPELSLSNLPSGTYLLRVRGSSFTLAQRVVKL